MYYPTESYGQGNTRSFLRPTGLVRCCCACRRMCGFFRPIQQLPWGVMGSSLRLKADAIVRAVSKYSTIFRVLECNGGYGAGDTHPPLGSNCLRYGLSVSSRCLFLGNGNVSVSVLHRRSGTYTTGSATNPYLISSLWYSSVAGNLRLTSLDIIQYSIRTEALNKPYEK